MKTFLWSTLALPFEWVWTRGAELPTVLDKEGLHEGSCLRHNVSFRRDQPKVLLSYSATLGQPSIPDPPCLALSAFYKRLELKCDQATKNGKANVIYICNYRSSRAPPCPEQVCVRLCASPVGVFWVGFLNIVLQLHLCLFLEFFNLACAGQTWMIWKEKSAPKLPCVFRKPPLQTS